MRHQATKWFTVNTILGRGWYRSRARAMSAARWIALDSGERVEVSDEATGHTWDVSPAGAEVAPIPAKADRGVASPWRAAVAAR